MVVKRGREEEKKSIRNEASTIAVRVLLRDKKGNTDITKQLGTERMVEDM
jgi:hypothetical protein